jgi:transposase
MGSVTPALTSDRRRRLLDFLRGGVPLDTAARLVGVEDVDVRVWRNRSQLKVRGYALFDDECRRAQAEGEAILLSRVTDAGKGNWRAATWLLERLYPERYGPRSALDLPDGPPLSDPETAEFEGL